VCGQLLGAQAHTVKENIMCKQIQKIQVYCNKCSNITNHIVLAEHDEGWSSQEGDDDNSASFLEGRDQYQIIKCSGCDEVSFIHNSWFSEDIDEHGCPLCRVKQYPPIQKRKMPSDIQDQEPFGPRLYSHYALANITYLLDEIYKSIDVDCYMLASMGIRSLIDTMMNDVIGDMENFTKKLDLMLEQGFISKKDFDILSSIIEVGHASTHRNFKPKIDVINMCLDIVEGLIKRFYLWPKHAQCIKEVTPKRGQSAKLYEKHQNDIDENEIDLSPMT
jgi:hypothetical protein